MVGGSDLAKECPTGWSTAPLSPYVPRSVLLGLQEAELLPDEASIEIRGLI